MDVKSVSIYSETYRKLISDVKVAKYMKTKQPTSAGKSEFENDGSADNIETQKKSCSFCKVEFSNQLSQRQHYKLDWHRYNLKLNLKQRKPINEEEFSTKAVADDVSSISGSETESEDDSESVVAPKVGNQIEQFIAQRIRSIFENGSGNFLSFSRSWFIGTKDQIQSETELIATIRKLPSWPQIFIVMLGGGHFAASIFNKSDAILHKTFHSYTVRAKQGGSQSNKDNKQSASKSAGASLRRYNERSLMQHVQEILASWSKEIASCDFIFLRAVGPNNQAILFNGKQACLERNDPRIRKIPFPTRRPTFNETKRVHSILTSIDVYESEDVFQKKFLGQSSTAEADLEIVETSPKREQNKVLNKPKSKSVTPPPSDDSLSKALDQLHLEYRNHQEEVLEIENVPPESTLNESEAQPVVEQVNKSCKKVKKKKKKIEPEQLPDESVLNFRKKVLTACTDNNFDSLEEILKSKGELITDEEVVFALNQSTPDNLTLVQFAAKHSYKELLQLILLHGGDPCAKNAKAMTAYDFATDKETRNVFRRFMGDFPDRYDYSKSHIPSVLNEDVEERQRAVKKAKRQREKERKKADEPRRKEVAEQKRFLELDDREKRALAAERRIMASLGKSGKDVVLLRCYRCAANITGKVPFNYENFSFCSMPCLKEHRQSRQSTSNDVKR